MTDPLLIPCPICRANVGETCENMLDGSRLPWHPRPHSYRVLVAVEDEIARRYEPEGADR
jgi:hypothetical protein